MFIGPLTLCCIRVIDCTVFLMMLGSSTSAVLATCWAYVFTACCVIFGTSTLSCAVYVETGRPCFHCFPGTHFLRASFRKRSWRQHTPLIRATVCDHHAHATSSQTRTLPSFRTKETLKDTLESVSKKTLQLASTPLERTYCVPSACQPPPNSQQPRRHLHEPSSAAAPGVASREPLRKFHTNPCKMGRGIDPGL